MDEIERGDLMAKLEGVKTLDMVNGEITKVEYDGAVYEKVDCGREEVVAGDIVRNNSDREDAKSGNFYEVVIGGVTHHKTSVRDDADDWHSDILHDCDVFRKVSAPTIEQVDVKLVELDTKVDALAERVTALEDERHVYGKPHTLSEGDTVKALVDGQFENIYAGDIGVVSDCNTGSELDLPQDLVKATDEGVAQAKRDAVFTGLGRKPNELKKGDIVRTKLYELLEVKSIDEGNSHPIRVTIEGMSVGMMAESCELVAPVEARVDR